MDAPTRSWTSCHCDGLGQGDDQAGRQRLRLLRSVHPLGDHDELVSAYAPHYVASPHHV